ncbi:hypothetical protein GGR52DRAFT_568673 [Hypoxylon sp. FL1284]|nr:hypothetical protein GGR52DRAFT_568673 [Hypoxylon sp. FL1284]
MADQQVNYTPYTAPGGVAKDVSVRTQTIIWPASTFITTWTLGSSSDPTESPATVAPVSDSSSASQSVGPILSGVVVFLVLVLVLWMCCGRNRTNGRRSRRSSRRRGSGYASKCGSSTSPSSPSSSGTSQNGASAGSAASEVVEDQWDQTEQVPEEHIPKVPPPVATAWHGQVPGQIPGQIPGQAPGQAPDQGVRLVPVRPVQGMQFPVGPRPMMSPGGPPLVGRGGPPPVIIGRGGPPPGALH